MTDTEEKVLIVAHRHPATLLRDALVTFLPGMVVIVLLLLLRGAQESVASAGASALVTLLVPLCFLVLWTILFFQWTNYYLDMVVVTDRRVFYASQVNFTQRTNMQWRIPDIRIADARYENLFGSYFNYGSLILDDGTGPVVIRGVRDPQYLAAVILKQDDRFGELQETARRQDELLHFVSHEVKGHLAKSKAAFAAIVEGDYGQAPDQLKAMASDALADSEKGVDTVMSILDSSRAAQSDIKLVAKPFDLVALAHRASAEFGVRASKKQLLFDTRFPATCMVLGDEEKIERHVVRNLLENAIRYTPAGRIAMTIEIAGDAARFSVADSGIGIAAEDMENLFKAGAHGEHSRDVNPDSTGYGLFVAKKIIDAHGGRIWARSEGPGSGSTFSFELPLSH